MAEPLIPQLPEAVRASFEPIMKALGPARQKLAGVKEVVKIRPGYTYPADGAPQPALVIAITPGAAPPIAEAAELEKTFNVPVAIADATVDEQLTAEQMPVSFGLQSAASSFETLLAGEEAIAFAPPKTGSYENLEPPDLPLVKERMELTICVSPEAGWSELESFLGATRKSLTVAMYQFTAPHIFEAVNAAVTPQGREFELVLHPVPEKPAKSGVKAQDLDEEQGVIEPLEEKLRSRFEMAWATLKTDANPDGLWASAYHIKVAVRDGGAVWLSSGNWQSSNQPDIHPFGETPDKLPPGFQRKYNRDYHAVIVNERLASIYETYIKRDFDLASAQAGKATAFALPDLFVPEEEEEAPAEFAAPAQLFPPLRLDRVVAIQPLLTPDNYAANALDLIRSAQASVWFQNQYINFRGTEEDFAEFRLLVGALKEKIDAGLDVRIICRDLMKQESLDVLVALGFPKEVFRFQPACHNKTIIVDRKVVMFGSHNWSNEGVKTNRDASLIFDDREIAEYLAQVYEYDWGRLATAHPAKRQPRVAGDDEAPPPGMKRVSFSSFFDD